MISEKFLDNRIKLVIGLLLPAVLLYYKSIKYEFTTLDEQWLIIENTNLPHTLKTIREAFTKSIFGVYYRPLLLTSFLIDYQVGKLSPVIYHFTNLLIHLVCVLLLFKLLRLNAVSKRIAFFLSLIFSVHPMMLHAVAWIPGRNDLLLCLFSLCSIIFLLEYFNFPKKKFLVLHILFFCLALFTKETAIALPVIFTANFFVFKKKDFMSFLPFLFGWLLISLAWIWLRNSIVSAPVPDKLSMIEVIKNFLSAMILYSGKAIFSVQQSILPFLKNVSLIPGLIAIGLLVFLAFKPGINDKKIAGLGLLFFFLFLLLPVWFSAARGGVEHYEHRIYTAMAGMLLFFSKLKFDSNSKTVKLTALSIFLIFCFKTYSRMDVYKNKENFINAGLQECPGNYLFLLQKSELLFTKHEYRAALNYCNQAIVLRPDKTQLYFNRGVAYYQLGSYKQAISDFSETIRRSSKLDAKSYLNRAVAYEKNNEIGKAMKDLIFLGKHAPGSVSPVIMNSIEGKWTMTLNLLTEQVKKNNTDSRPFFQRSLFCFESGLEQDGLEDLEIALSLDPTNKAYLKTQLLHNKGTAKN